MEPLYSFYLKHPFVQTDTRALKEGEIFFALKGPQFNGNLYAKTALEKGAAGVVIDEPIGIEGDHIFLVEDVLRTLQALALHHRKQFSIPFIAITGSNGKTTTKELIHAVLSTTYKTYTTKGNLNNHIGIPLTLLAIKKDAEMAIIEMGANHQKEIESYCTYVRPTHGIINNCGKAHLEGFGGVEGVRKGKGELFDFLAEENGIAFVNGDLDYLITMSEKINQKIYYGNTRGKYISSIFQNDPFLVMEIQNEKINTQKIFTQLVGAYNKPNVDAAICIGDYFQIPFDKIRDAIEAYVPENARSQWMEKGDNAIILDAYNANPNSMQAAIENFSRQNIPHKVVLLGAMMELGSDSLAEHQMIIRQLQSLHFNHVILVGGDFEKVDHPYTFFKNVEEASKWLKNHPIKNSTLLIKGSRSMKMEKILEVM
ncbi:MAG: UDP-N-acetylmuramoyl-tripeptide--D-alanyl-D-alanine ligase [Chitinophagia bacterium]|jgi:UDP-N-acetylmuramoyl-tripeptide--D-alanyl-D-alanine ligase|nr:UDP-N-acetylmuramoyl-tripeptide--D-alanyl-D-alanine ligase [Chitinophagia bacterium]